MVSHLVKMAPEIATDITRYRFSRRTHSAGAAGALVHDPAYQPERSSERRLGPFSSSASFSPPATHSAF
jgi:hypothetical protein